MELFGFEITGFFHWLITTTIQASVIICIVMAVKILLSRKLAPRWHYWLWLVVVVRMVLPSAPQSGLSVFNLMPSGSKMPQHNAVLTVETEIAAAVNEYETEPEARAVIENPGLDQKPIAAAGEAAGSDAGSEQALPITAISKESADFTALLPLVWIIGAAVLGLYVFAGNVRLWRIVRQQRPVTDSGVLNLLEDCKGQMNLHTYLSVVETDRVISPALFGFVRPRLLLPMGILDKLSSGQLRHIFLHELAHLKRGDIYLGWLTAFLQTLHWFNPFVWVAFHKMRADRELACDQLVLSVMQNEESEEYGKTIVSLLEDFSAEKYNPGLAGILEERSQLKRRITMIAKHKKSSYGFSLLAGFAMVFLVAVGLTNATDSSSLDAKKEKASEFVDFLIEERFDKAVENFDKTMKNALPVERLSEVWKATTGQAGAFEKKLGTRADKYLWSDIIYVTCQFQAGPMDIKVVYDRNGMVSGLWFVPVPQRVLEGYTNQAEAFEEPLKLSDSNIVNLSNGVTVELVGVCKLADCKIQDFWKPDGTSLEAPFYVKDNPSIRETAYGFLIRTGKPFSFIKWDISGASDHFETLDLLDSDSELTELYKNNQEHLHIVKIDDLHETEVKLNIGLGWNDVVKYDGKYTIGQSHDKVRFNESYDSSEGAKVVFRSDFEGMEIRLEALMKGNSYSKRTAKIKGAMDASGQKYNIAIFKDISLAQIREFQFKTRPQAQTIVFKNVSLSPRSKTNEQVEKSTSAYAAYWKFDEGSGNIAHDSSNNKNHGYLETGLSNKTGRVTPVVKRDRQPRIKKVSLIPEKLMGSWRGTAIDKPEDGTSNYNLQLDFSRGKKGLLGSVKGDFVRNNYCLARNLKVSKHAVSFEVDHSIEDLKMQVTLRLIEEKLIGEAIPAGRTKIGEDRCDIVLTKLSPGTRRSESEMAMGGMMMMGQPRATVISRPDISSAAGMIVPLYGMFRASYEALFHENNTEKCLGIIQRALPQLDTFAGKLKGTDAEMPVVMILDQVRQIQKALEAGNVDTAKGLLDAVDRAGPQLQEMIEKAARAEKTNVAIEKIPLEVKAGQVSSLHIPAGAGRRVRHALETLSNAMSGIEAEIAGENDMHSLSAYFTQINECCDDLQGKNKEEIPDIGQWGQLPLRLIDVLELLHKIEETAEGCRSLAQGDHKDYLNQHWQTLKGHYDSLCVMFQPKQKVMLPNTGFPENENLKQLTRAQKGKLFSAFMTIGISCEQIGKKLYDENVDLKAGDNVDEFLQLCKGVNDIIPEMKKIAEGTEFEPVVIAGTNLFSMFYEAVKIRNTELAKKYLRTLQQMGSNASDMFQKLIQPVENSDSKPKKKVKKPVEKTDKAKKLSTRFISDWSTVCASYQVRPEVPTQGAVIATDFGEVSFGNTYQKDNAVFIEVSDKINRKLYEVRFIAVDRNNKTVLRNGGGHSSLGDTTRTTLRFDMSLKDTKQFCVQIRSHKSVKGPNTGNTAENGEPVYPIEFDKTVDFLEGDSIEITEILGTDSKIEPGHTYTVKGKYKLTSCERARLCLYATDGETRCEQGPIVEKGQGEFTRIFTYKKEGWLHLSFYPAARGGSFGNLYFNHKSGYVPDIDKVEGVSSIISTS